MKFWTNDANNSQIISSKLQYLQRETTAQIRQPKTGHLHYYPRNNTMQQLAFFSKLMCASFQIPGTYYLSIIIVSTETPNLTLNFFQISQMSLSLLLWALSFFTALYFGSPPYFLKSIMCRRKDGWRGYSIPSLSTSLGDIFCCIFIFILFLSPLRYFFSSR